MQEESGEKQWVSLEAAAARIAAQTKCLLARAVPIEEAAGLRLAEDIYARQDQPPFSRSPLDGYAVRAADVKSADRNAPAVLRVIGRVYAGEVFQGIVGPGETVRIMTGAPVPDGADTVIRQEDTDCGEDSVRIFRSSAPYQNYCRQGEDYRKGALLLEKGRRLNYAAIAVLASSGYGWVKVWPRPRIALVCAGTELTAPGESRAEGKIFDSNLPMLQARLREWGFSCRAYRAEDDPEAVKRLLLRVLKEADGVITAGGVSVGEKDVLRDVLPKLCGSMEFDGILLKPGAPAKFALYHGKPVLALSGNPFAAAVGLELLGRPMLDALSGEHRLGCPRITARLENPFPKESPGRRMIRGRYRGGSVWIPEEHASGQIYSMLDCNCLVDVKAGTGAMPAGSTVEVWLLEARVEKPAEDLAESLAKEQTKPQTEEDRLREDRMKQRKKTGASGISCPILAISGRKNAGKTTFLEGVLPLLCERGLHVAVLKHDGHSFEPDVPGTDSFRLRRAGAEAVAVWNESRFFLTREEQVSEDWLARQVCGADLILCEGLKNSGYPKIEVIRSALSEEMICRKETVAAVATDSGREYGVPKLGLEDYAAAADKIMEYISCEGERAGWVKKK